MPGSVNSLRVVAGIERFLYAKPMQRAFTLPSFAKINWILRILGRRDHGFHELFTIFQTISLHDTISFAAARNKLTLTCDDKSVPRGERNLIMGAAMALRFVFGIKKGATMHLEKRIPSPGGLGGGSSNAATALIGLTKLWQIEARYDDLYQIAFMLGSDATFFLHGGTAIGTGCGEIITPLADTADPNMLIVTPNVSVLTKDAFERIDAPTLTNEASNRILRDCRKKAESLDPRHSVLINDFEESVFDAYPEIRRVKETLLELGAVNAAMSGSGASVFAIFDKTETRQAALKALDHESTWRKFAVATISRSEYREALRV